MSVNTLYAKSICWPSCTRHAPNPLFQPHRSISAVVGLKCGSLFHQKLSFFYSQINASLFFSRGLRGSYLVKKSSENREKLGKTPSSLLNSSLLVGRGIWSQYNLASWGQVYILCLLGSHPYEIEHSSFLQPELLLIKFNILPLASL